MLDPALSEAHGCLASSRISVYLYIIRGTKVFDLALPEAQERLASSRVSVYLYIMSEAPKCLI